MRETIKNLAVAALLIEAVHIYGEIRYIKGMVENQKRWRENYEGRR